MTTRAIVTATSPAKPSAVRHGSLWKPTEVVGRLFRFALWLAARLPQSWAMRIAQGLGWLWPRGETYRVIAANLEHCFPGWSHSERRRVTRARLGQVVLLFFEFGQLLFWDEDKLLAQIKTVAGAELLEADVAAPDAGTLMLVPHFGNWEILCAYLGRRHRLTALYDPPKQAGLEPVILEARQRYSGKMFPIDVAGMRGIVKELRAGGLVCVLPDQVPARDAGVYADFFGRAALTMTLSHRLQQRTHARVLLGSVRRDAHGRYALTFERLALGETSEDSARIINAAIEALVLSAPEQYQWDYKRFKRPPEHVAPGVRNIYRRQ